MCRYVAMQDFLYCDHGDRVARAWSSPLTSTECWDQKWVDLFLHSPLPAFTVTKLGDVSPRIDPVLCGAVCNVVSWSHVTVAHLRISSRHLTSAAIRNGEPPVTEQSLCGRTCLFRVNIDKHFSSVKSVDCLESNKSASLRSNGFRYRAILKIGI